MRQPCRLRRVTSSHQSSLAALIRFHWAAGARVALRANGLTLGIVVFVFGYAPAPEALKFLRHFVLGVVARTTAPDQGPRMTLAGIAAALAVAAVPRVSLGSAGWMRSLPVDRRMSWRAAVVAATAAQIAIAAFALIGAAASLVVYHVPVSLAKVVTIPVMMVAVAATVIPGRNPFGRLLAAAACAASIAGTWRLLAPALLLLALADIVTNGIPSSRPQRRRSRSPRSLGGTSGTAIWVRATWRAMGVRGVIGSALVPVVPTAFAYFITRNNPDFSTETAALVTRVCGGIALAIFVAGSANALLEARQPWLWARSLPWSSTDRVVADVFALGLPLLAVPIALAPLSARQALIVATLIPLMASLGAAALRGTGKRQTGAAGESLVLTLIAGVGVGLWPALSLVALASTPLMIRWASVRERRLRMTQWSELHHSAAGDPTWLTKT